MVYLLFVLVAIQEVDFANLPFLEIGKRIAPLRFAERSEQLEREKEELEIIRTNTIVTRGTSEVIVEQNGKKAFAIDDKRKVRDVIKKRQDSIRQIQETLNNFPGWSLDYVRIPPGGTRPFGVAQSDIVLKVLQIIGPDEMIVETLSRRDPVTMIIKGMPTKSLRDGSGVEIKAETGVYITQKTYQTVLGAAKTVHCINVIEEQLVEFLATKQHLDVPNLKPISFRTWTAKSGDFTVDASIANIEKLILTLKKEDGETIDVKLSDLSADDQKFVQKWRNP